ncbi:MAG: sulfatase-like hydrolase/transferase [Proteobacteria bacterium]|nr:sulfatase-like hydrolase/transferase [Pseudomonadota bacterium]
MPDFLPRRVAAILLALACITGLFAGVYFYGGPPEQRIFVKVASADDRDANVVFIVLDTVRSDHMSLCGYERPTTPFLRRLVQEGAEHTCGAITAGSWTLPTHASFFTGVDPVEHRAHAITSGIKDFSGASSRARKLDGALPTLAEQMAEKGYQTVAFSANPVVSSTLGLFRGFEFSHASKKFGDLYDDAYAEGLTELLSEVNYRRPMFLFLNISDAHQPWKDIPEGIGWVAKRKRLKYAKLDPDSLWRRYVENRMDDDEVQQFRDRIRDLYDYGVFRADRNVMAALEVLDQGGWCNRGCRVVITSDHGEFLGEHQLLDHGHYLWEEDVRVPLVVAQIDGPKLPDQINATHAFHLVRDGALPGTMAPVTSMAWPHVRRCALTETNAFCATSAAIWNGGEKLLWMDEERWRIDLGREGEEVLEPLGEHPLSKPLDELADRVQQDARDDGDADQDVMELLRAVGYIE